MWITIQAPVPFFVPNCTIHKSREGEWMGLKKNVQSFSQDGHLLKINKFSNYLP